MKRRGRLLQVVSLATLMSLAGGPARAQQPGCGGGVIRVAGNLNARFEVCGDLGPRVPQLQKQLNELQKTLTGNDALLQEVSV